MTNPPIENVTKDGSKNMLENNSENVSKTTPTKNSGKSSNRSEITSKITSTNGSNSTMAAAVKRKASEPIFSTPLENQIQISPGQMPLVPVKETPQSDSFDKSMTPGYYKASSQKTPKSSPLDYRMLR